MSRREDLGTGSRFGLALMDVVSRALFKIRVSGLEHLPDSGPAVIAGNHVSALDGVLLGIVVWRRRGRVTRFLTAAEFFSKRIFGRVLHAFRQIPLRRGEGDMDALGEAIATVRDGAVAGIYPEGRVNPDPEAGLQRGRTGVARIALAASAPVIPVGAWGAQRRWPRDGLRLALPLRPVVALAFGEPIQLEGDSAIYEETQRATDRVMEEIDAQVAVARELAGP